MPVFQTRTSPCQPSDPLFSLAANIGHAYRRYKATAAADDAALNLVCTAPTTDARRAPGGGGMGWGGWGAGGGWNSYSLHSFSTPFGCALWPGPGQRLWAAANELIL